MNVSVHVVAAEPADVIPLILYPWLGVSLAVYGYRIYRRTILKRDRDQTTAESAATATPDAPRSAKVIRSSRPPVETVDRPGSLVQAVIREEVEARKRAEAESTPGGGITEGRGGLFAPRDSAPRRVPVAEALAGIALPCDLVPLIDRPDAVDPHCAVFATRGFPPAEVGGAFADELERLGFSMRTEGETTVIARKGAVEVRVDLHPEPEHVMRGDRAAFPTARAGDIVVEVTS